MRNIYLTFIALFYFANLFAQHGDYDNTSKWFLGLNAGATWNSTDVKNKMGYIKKGDMSAETRALPDEVVKPPKGIGSSEKDMGPFPKKPVKKFSKGGSASSRADGCATKGKTKGRII